MSPHEPVLNGILPDGSYAYSRPSDAEVAQWLVPYEPPPKSRLRAPARGVDTDDLSSAGWGIVYPKGRRSRYERLLHDLLELRREQAGDLYRSEPDLDVYSSKETCGYFLQRQGTHGGQADPSRLPYYLLLVGSPEEISFDFQSQLDQIYAVGRLYFENDEGYASYAKSVRDAETDPPWKARRKAVLFGASTPGDDATVRITERLMNPLAREIERRTRRRPDWRTEQIFGPGATRDVLAGMLTGEDAPDLLITSSHGMAFPRDDSRQRGHQGALLCSDWPGPGTPAAREYYLAAEDLSLAGRPLHGAVTCHIACHSGGTPEWDSFHPPGDEKRRRLADRPFVAALPQRLLAEAGVLAVIAHVDRAWTTSFDWALASEEPDPKVFLDTILPLIDGCRVGDATESLGAHYGFLATQVKEAWESCRNRERRDPQRSARLWRATNDVRSFMVFGDPAVRVGGGAR